MRLSPLLLCLGLVAAAHHSTRAQAAEPAAALPLWPAAAPGDGAPSGEERDTSRPSDGRVAGRPVIRTGNVYRPTISFYPAPADKNTGAVVLVCPGGGYNILALDLEGTEVCEWLTSQGVNAALLKYRVPRREGREKQDAPLEDAQRALGMIRRRAAEWAVDPARVGILGFSAGGHLAAAASCRASRSHPRVDDADDLPCRPDFTLLIYPAYLTSPEGSLDLAPEIAVNAQTPPAFVAMTADDPVRYENAVAYAIALRKAGRRAELHLYPSGGHGYGLRQPGPAVVSWPQRAQEWLRAEGWLAPRKSAP